MYDSSAVAGEHSVHYLGEEVSSEPLIEEGLAVDEVEEIFAGLRTLQDQDEGVGTLVEIQELDHSRNGGHLAEKGDL